MFGAVALWEARGRAKETCWFLPGDQRLVFSIRSLTAADVMTKSPITIEPNALVHDALALMEDRPSQISVLPVVDADARCLGLIRLHDIYQAGAKQD